MGLRGIRLVVAALVVLIALPGVSGRAGAVRSGGRPVIVATFDTGTNPFHPCFRRAGAGHPRARIAGYPAESRSIRLTFAEDYRDSLAASKTQLDAVEPETLYHVAGTNLSFFGGSTASTELVDNYPHGAQASSQIACAEYGLAPDVQLVILNWYDTRRDQAMLLDWVAAQPWIDVVHLNIQDVPLPAMADQRIRAVIASGKLVVIAAGNGVAGAGAAYPMELSSYNSPRGSLIAGANDNGGYAYFSNYNPHVVMDGMATRAAQPTGFGSTSFGGTSSASPRITGYVARLLRDLRDRFGHTGQGMLTIPPGRARPAGGPLVDGRLTVAELHEVVRKTADPNPHQSRFDGQSGVPPVPQPVGLPFAFYPKMGYGEVSEHTLAEALAVAAGTKPMPVRPDEDQWYSVSETLRR